MDRSMYVYISPSLKFSRSLDLAEILSVRENWYVRDFNYFLGLKLALEWPRFTYLHHRSIQMFTASQLN